MTDNREILVVGSVIQDGADAACLPFCKDIQGLTWKLVLPLTFTLVIEQSRVSSQLGSGSPRFLSGKLVFFAEAGRQ